MFRNSDQNVENQSYHKQHSSEVIIETLYPSPHLYPSSEDEEKENNRALMTVSSLQSHLVAEPRKIAHSCLLSGT